MRRTELQILWCGILVVVMAIIFPPFGYDRIDSTTVPSAQFVSLGIEIRNKTESISWKFVGYSFVFSPPKDSAVDLANKKSLDAFVDSNAPSYTEEKPHVRIMWHILLAEIAVVVLVGIGVFATARKVSPSRV